MSGNMELEILHTLLYVIGGLVALLGAVIGWIGTRIHSRLDSIATSLQAIEKDLRGDLTNLDRRVVKLEVKMKEDQ